MTSLLVNDMAAIIEDEDFSVTIPVREGKNMLIAVATKENGRTGTNTVDITRDNIAPVVRIDSPRNGFVSVTETIAVTGLVNDVVNGATNARVFVNGSEATVASGAFMIMDVPLVPGANTIDALATDAVGNRGSHSIQVSFQEPVGARIMIESGNGQSG